MSAVITKKRYRVQWCDSARGWRQIGGWRKTLARANESLALCKNVDPDGIFHIECETTTIEVVHK